MCCCEYFKDGICEPLDERCPYLKHTRNCGFRSHYACLTHTKGDPPRTAEIKRAILPKALKGWREHFHKLPHGGRQMTARPLEDAIKDAVELSLKPMGVQVQERKKMKIIKEYNIIMDIRIEKKGYPTTLISVKSYLGKGEFRNSFTNAYFVKLRKGLNNVRFYIVTMILYCKREMVDLARPYIDGIYSLDKKPYIDELFDELQSIYSRGLVT